MAKTKHPLILLLETIKEKWETVCKGLFVLLGIFVLIGAGGYLYIIKNLNDIKVSVEAGTDLFGLIICLILYITSYYERHEKEIEMIFHSILVYMESALLCFDIIVLFCNGNIEFLLLHRIGMFLLYFTLIVMLVTFWGYMKNLLDEWDQKNILTDRIIIYLAAIIIFLQVLNLKFGFLYTIDANSIYRRGNFLVSVGGPAIMLICIIIHIIRNNSQTEIRNRLLVYSFLPLLFNISQLFDLGFNMMYISNLFVLILCYNNVSHQRGIDLAKKNALLAKQENDRLEYQTAIMLSQIKPHFIYNVLGSISMLYKIDPDKAAEATDYFAKYLRANIDTVNKRELVLFSLEMEHINNYVYLEKMRFDDLEVNMEDIEFDDFLVPSLAIQPLVENAIKHGIMGKEEGGILTIKEYESKQYHHIIIEDNGIGYEKKDIETKFTGINNSKYRLKNMVGGELMIESEKNKGTIVTILIPK